MSVDPQFRKAPLTGLPLMKLSFDAVDLLDLTHVITFAADLEPLKGSIARAGILHPPILQEIRHSYRYRVVSGYKRLRALQILGADEVSAHVSTEEDDLQLFLLNLEENLGTRPLNVVEKALALDKLSRQFGLSRDVILHEHLPALGLGSDPRTLDLYLSLSELEDETKEGLASGELSMAAAQQMTALAPADRLAFVRLVSTLSPGKTHQRELLALLMDLGRKEKTSIGESLAEEEIVSAMHDEDAQAPLRARRVRELLIKRRYPRYSQAVEQFEKLRKKLKLPPHVSLKAPPFFEGQDWRLSVTFRDRKELEAARKVLQRMAEDPFLNPLLHFHLS